MSSKRTQRPSADMTQVLQLGMSLQQFLTRHWQKQPLLVRHAFKQFQSPISPNELAGIACEADALARVISGQGQRFRVQQGPFDAAFFAALPKRNWTLLVQNVDRWDIDVRALLAHFAFLPHWRIEDIMVSYAVQGGSVGAHVDQYDVFLLQAAGHRRWQIDAPGADRTLRKGGAVKLLQNFQPAHSMDLAPGDMLYLPPGVGHHGVALDDQCMTFSIGLRAPSDAELLADFAGFVCNQADDAARYQDPELTLRKNNYEINQHDVLRAKASIQRALQQHDAQFADWFAGFMTRYRANALPALAATKTSASKPIQLPPGAKLVTNPEFRFAQRKNQLYVGGQRVTLPTKLIEKLLLSGLAETDLAPLSAPHTQALSQLLAKRALRRAK